MKVRFETTGCRLNQIETESAAKIFIDKSFSVTLDSLTSSSPVDNDAILCVINTCAVTQKAEQKDRRMIRIVLEKCPNATVIVTGCYAQLSQDFIKSMNDRVAVLPGQLKSRIEDVATLLEKYKTTEFNPSAFANELNSTLFAIPAAVSGKSENPFKLSTDSFMAHSRSSIKIQDGCNNSCTYCAIHLARGKSVSLDVESVLNRVIQLEKVGQKEVVFTTVNINHYRGEYNGKYLKFAELLDLCLQKTSTIAFRISSLYPEVVDDYFCSVIKNPRVRPHFHISVQSGSDKILKLMGRSYVRQTVVDACNKLRIAKENPFIACDIITGFPNETDEDFEETMKLCKECDFAWVHVFPYSERSGTVAASMKNKVPQFIRGERAKKVTLWASEQKVKYIDSCKNKVFDAVLEMPKKLFVYNKEHNAKKLNAVTENFLHCEIIGEVPNELNSGDSAKVIIVDSINDNAKKGGEIECFAKIFHKPIEQSL